MALQYYGFWGGPGWSDNHYTLPNEEPKWNGPTKDVVDERFRDHDHAYWNAEKAYKNSQKNDLDRKEFWASIIAADTAVTSELRSLMLSDTLDAVQFAAAAGAADAFRYKNLYWNFPGYVNAHTTLAYPDSAGTEGDPFTGMPWGGIAVDTNTAYTTAQSFRPRRDPLAIDLDGDGIETVGITATPVLFDHNADGIKTGTGWVSGDDAWLALDRDGNGLIDSGRELFGVDTLLAGTAGAPNAVYASSGFEALKTLDSNNDNVFDAADTAFTQVRLWQDLNQDGVSQAGELFTLTQKNITSIGLVASTATTNLGNGNTVSGTAVVTRTNGSTTLATTVSVGDDNTTNPTTSSTMASNLNLANNPFYRTFTTAIPLTTQAQGLPEMRGSGWVRDLREAMSLGNPQAASLASNVAQFASSTSRATQLATLDTLMVNWADSTGKLVHSTYQYNMAVQDGRLVTSDLGTTLYLLTLTPQGLTQQQNVGPGAYITVPTAEGTEVLRRVNVLEVFNGNKFIQALPPTSTSGVLGLAGGGAVAGAPITAIPLVSTLGTAQIDLINQSYEALKDSVYGALVLQTRLQPYLDSIGLTVDATGVHFDITALAASLEALHTSNAAAALDDLADLALYADRTLTSVGFEVLQQLHTWLDPLPANDPLRTQALGLGISFAASTVGTSHKDIYLGDAADNTFNAGAGDGVRKVSGPLRHCKRLRNHRKAQPSRQRLQHNTCCKLNVYF